MTDPHPKPTALPSAVDDLEALAARIWDELQAATLQRGHGWRTATLATVTPEGLPDARTIVLREADRGAAALVFYTDERSPKVAQMQAQPRGVIVVWSAALGWQLRLQVQLGVASSGLAVSSRWATLKMTPAAQDYLSPLPPGSRLGLANPIARSSRAHFAVVTATVTEIDWLQLSANGHRRARFAGDQPGCWLQA